MRLPLKCRANAIVVPALRVVVALGILLTAGCASNGVERDPRDPWEPMNRAFYDFNEVLDNAILEPVAEVYVELPQGLRTSVTNFFINLSYPTTAINQFLQGKVETGFEDTMRFIFNSTLGLAGFIDIAGPAGLARHDEDFGQTFAVWGMGSGPFINWPILGPSTVRDTAGIPFNLVTGPLFFIETGAEFIALYAVDAVDTRARLIPAVRLRDETALDPYVFTREAYLQQRLNLIYDGDPPLQVLDDVALPPEQPAPGTTQ